MNRLIKGIMVTMLLMSTTLSASFITTWETNETNETIQLGISFDNNDSNESFLVNWGDSSSDTNITATGETPSHEYATEGNHTITITGDAVLNLELSGSLNLRTVESWGSSVKWHKLDSAFANCTNLEYNATDTPPSSEMNSTVSMFQNIKSVAGLEGWDTSTITDMSSMFSGVDHFNEDLSSWDTGKVLDMSNMFSDTNDTNPNIADWNVTSVVKMISMFSSSSFDQNLSTWLITNVEDMSGIFYKARMSRDNLVPTLLSWGLQGVRNISADIGLRSVVDGDDVEYYDYNYSDIAPALVVLIHDNNWTISENGTAFPTVRVKKIDNITKPEDFTEYNLEFTQPVTVSPPVDDRNNTREVSYSVDINDSSIISFEFNETTNTIEFTSVKDMSGMVRVEVNATDNFFVNSITFDVNITGSDDAPTVEANITSSLSDPALSLSYEYSTIRIIGLVEDPSPTAFTFTLSATDPEGDTITYSIDTDYDHSLVTISIDSNTGLVTITPVADASGIARFEIIVEANGESVKQRYDIVIDNIPNPPSIDYISLSNMTIDEDTGIVSYEINVSDGDGDDINLTIESNNTLLMTVLPSWSGIISKANWMDTTLEFNLSTVPDAYGSVRITVTAADDTNHTSQSFDIVINSVYDPISVAPIADKIYYKNFTDKNITIDLSMGDSTALGVNYTISPNSDVGLSITDNILTVSSTLDFNGTTDVNITVSDGTTDINISFVITVLTVDETNMPDTDQSVSVDGSVVTTTIDYIYDGLKLQRIIDENVSGCIKLISADKETQLCSSIPRAVTDFIINGGGIVYDGVHGRVESSLMIDAFMRADIPTAESSVRFQSRLAGVSALLSMSLDDHIEFNALYHSYYYDLKVGIDDLGAISNQLIRGLSVSTTASSIVGSSVIMEDIGSIQLNSGYMPSGDYRVYAVLSMSIEGEIVSSIIKVAIDDIEVISVSRSLLSGYAFGLGSKSEIEVYDGHLFIKTTAVLTDNIVVE